MRITTTISVVLLAALAAGPALATDNGGTASSAPAHIRSVGCSTHCADLSAAKAGSLIRVNGTGMEQVTRVVFLGSDQPGDDRSAKVTKRRPQVVYVRVPPEAIGGPLMLVNRDGTRSPPTPPIVIDRGPTRIAASGTAPPVDAMVDARKAFFGGRPPGLSFLVKGSDAVSVAVALVARGTETVVANWSPGRVEPGTVQSIQWNGIDATTGKAALPGLYEFRVYTSTATARAAQNTQPTAAPSFLFLDHAFPIRGPHRYGEGAARFGAGRGGHVHQGQDVFAACGTPLVAARGGIVKFQGYQAAAGNFIVLDGRATGIDSAYMHLRQPALFKKGADVRTGDVLGFVGQTGDASACHLHFEEWSAPGWYTGGHPLDPVADLRAWDQFS